MATNIGGKYLLEDIYSRHWAKFASEGRLPTAEVLEMGRTMAETLPGVFTETIEDARSAGLEHPIMSRMIDVFSERSEHCARILEAAPD